MSKFKIFALAILLSVCTYTPTNASFWDTFDSFFENFFSEAFNIPFFEGNLFSPNNQKFTYKTYSEALIEWKKLADDFPEFVTYNTANELYPEIGFEDNVDYKCAKNETCIIPIITIGNKSKQSAKTPQIFLSGALHGDELPGIQTAYQVANILTKDYGSHPSITYLMDNVNLVIMPFANAWGYHAFDRNELQVDPNRDFKNKALGGFSTFAAQAMHHVFYDNLFMGAITWHAGTESISYEWGDYDHCTQVGFYFVSHESPDWASQATLAYYLNDAAKSYDITYQVGPMCDVVYPVIGGMEDWSYSASWLPDVYPEEELYKGAPFPPYNEHSFKCSTFLVETSNDKQHSNLGSYDDVYYPNTEEGVVSQNIRLALALMEFAHPQIIIDNQDTQIDITNGFTTQLVPVGCEYASSIKFIIYEGMCESLHTQSEIKYEEDLMSYLSCLPLGVWHYPTIKSFFDSEVLFNSITLKYDNHLPAGNYCGMISSKFDQHWGIQVNPDPDIKPQTLIAKYKLEEGYIASSGNGEHTLESHTTWYFPKHNIYNGMDMFVL